MPFSCFITCGTHHINPNNHHLALRLLCMLLEHQKRWRAIEIRLPYTFIDELYEDDALPYFMLRTEELGMLEEINVEGTFVFRICGTSDLSSLASLELELDYDEDATEWLVRSPSLEKLNISAIVSDGDAWNTSGCPIKFEKLRYLKLDAAPLSVLQLLDCPALEDLASGNWYSPILPMSTMGDYIALYRGK